MAVCFRKRSAELLQPGQLLNYFFITNIARGKLSKLVNNLDVAIEPFFTTEELDQLAREQKFDQRKGKLNGSRFLDLIVFNSASLKSQSLNDLSVTIKDRYGIEIKKQSLHERFNRYALLFLKQALEEMLQKQLDVDLPLNELKGIERILIKDSVCFQIDESLAKYFPGSGGSGSGAAVRIQFEYNILSGMINDLSVNGFNDQDCKNSVSTVELTKPGDLIIRDLAYMSLTALGLFIERLAFFLCRLDSKVKAYEESKGGQYKEIDFMKITRYMKKHGVQILEKEAYIGSRDRIKVRLIIHLLPSEEVAERLRKARKENKKKCRGVLSKEYIARSHLNLFITNASPEQVPTKHVWSLYRLRWQIELAFKAWKSVCDLEKVKKVNRFRLECYIYSRLIFIVLGWKLLWKITKHLYVKEGKTLSFFKAYKTLVCKKTEELRDVFILGKGSVEDFMIKLYDLSRTNHLLEKRRQEPTSMELLVSCLTS